MRIAVLSDIHGNRHAFEAVLADVAASDGATSSGAWATSSATAPTPTPASRWRASTRDVCLAGNHDLAVTGELPLDEFSRGAAIAARWTPGGPRARERSRACRPEPAGRGATASGLYHASPRDPVWEYVLSALLAELCLDAQRPARLPDRPLARRAVASSAPRASRRPASRAAAATRLDLSGGEWLLNPGSVGQPRDGDPRAAWLLLDTERRDAPPGSARSTTSRAPQAAIRAARLPDSLAERLEYGQ